MVVVVDVPDQDRRCSLGLAGPDAGVEELFGQSPVVALDLAVMPGRVGPDALVAGHGGHGSVERPGGVVGSVVGDHPNHPVDAVGGEEHPGPVEEPDRGLGGLIGQVLGVGQAGVTVDCGVQIDVARWGALGLGPLGGFVRRGAAAVGPPPATVGDAPDLLHIQVDHVAGVAGGDLPRGPVGRPVGVDVSAPVDAQPDQPAPHGRDRHHVPAAAQLQGDLAGGPLVLTPPRLDLVTQIETWRRKDKWTARQIALELRGRGHVVSVATVGRWLVRLGINRRRDIDPDGSTNRTPGKITARYPGHMVHLDVKKVGRIPDGGGWRAHGRGSAADKAAQRAKSTCTPQSTVTPAWPTPSTWPMRPPRPRSGSSTGPGCSSPPTASTGWFGWSPTTDPATPPGRSTEPCPPWPATSASGPTHPGTTARSSATTGPWPKSSSTPASGPARPSAPPRSRSGTSTTTTIEHTPPSGTDPRPHASTPASPTS